MRLISASQKGRATELAGRGWSSPTLINHASGGVDVPTHTRQIPSSTFFLWHICLCPLESFMLRDKVFYQLPFALSLSLSLSPSL
jgi:hypothetical protein